MKKKMFLVPAAVAIAFMVAVAAPSAFADSQSNEATGIFKIGEDGKSFGTSSMFDYGSEPDFIKAVASNGKEGYVKKEDLLEAEHQAATPEEAVELTRQHNEQLAIAFTRELEEMSGVAEIESSVTNEILESKMALNPEKPAAEYLASSGVELTDAQIDQALAEAMVSISTSIPVYDADGKTVIGEFLVG